MSLPLSGLTMANLKILYTEPPSDGRADMSVVVVGEIDLVTAAQLESALGEAVEGSRRGVNLDLSRVEFIDARGIGVIVEARRRAAASGHELVITAASKAVRRVVSLCDLDGLLFYRSDAGG